MKKSTIQVNFNQLNMAEFQFKNLEMKTSMKLK